MSRLERRVAALESKTVSDPLANLTDEQLDARIREMASELIDTPGTSADDVIYAQKAIGEINAWIN